MPPRASTICFKIAVASASTQSATIVSVSAAPRALRSAATAESFSGFRATSAKRAPLAAQMRAAASAMPEVAPMITTRFDVSLTATPFARSRNLCRDP